MLVSMTMTLTLLNNSKIEKDKCFNKAISTTNDSSKIYSIKLGCYKERVCWSKMLKVSRWVTI